MKNYNSREEFADPNTGLTGFGVTDVTGDSYKKIIDIPEGSKDKMFEAVRNGFLHHNGTAVEKTEIYMDMYRQMKSDDRLSAGYTLQQYHSAYAQAFKSAIKEYLLDSVLASTMLSNSEYIVMSNQAASDRQKLAELLNISNEQLSYMTNADAKCGLIKYGSSLAPFDNQFPKNTRLYKLMTTKPGRIVQTGIGSCVVDEA